MKLIFRSVLFFPTLVIIVLLCRKVADIEVIEAGLVTPERDVEPV